MTELLFKPKLFHSEIVALSEGAVKRVLSKSVYMKKVNFFYTFIELKYN